MENIGTFPAHWDEKQIICCMYFWIADADFKRQTDERNMIEQKLERLFLQRYDLSIEQKQGMIEEVISFIEGTSDQQKMALIRQFSDRVTLSNELYVEMIKAMEDIAMADDYISIEEHSLMYYIRLKFKKNSAHLVYS